MVVDISSGFTLGHIYPGVTPRRFARLMHDFANGEHAVDGVPVPLSDMWTYTGPTPKWGWINEGGTTVLHKFAAGEPRFVVDPATGESLGYRAEGQATNELLDNRDLSTGNWSGSATVTQDAVGLDGVANTASTVTDDSTDSALQKQQEIPVPDDSETHTQVYFVGKDSNESRFPELECILFGGTTLRHQVRLNTATGDSETSIADGSHTVHDRGAFWEVRISLKNNNSGNTRFFYTIQPAYSASLGGPQDDSVTGSIVYDFGGVRLNATEFGSPIETGASAVTRNADDASEPLPASCQDGFVWVVSARTPPVASGTQWLGLIAADSGVANDRIVLLYRDDETIDLIVDAGGSRVVSFSLGSAPADSDIKVAARLDQDNYAACMNGGTVSSESNAAFPSVQQKYIGNDEDGDRNWGSTIALDYLDPDPPAWTDADLQNASAL